MMPPTLPGAGSGRAGHQCRAGRGDGVLAGPRAARPDRRARPFHAGQRAGQGVGLLRGRPGRRRLADRLPAARGAAAGAAAGIRGAPVRRAAVPAQAGHGGVAERVGGGFRRPDARRPAQRHVLPRGWRRRLRGRRDRAGRAAVQGARPGRRLRPAGQAARPGVGYARRRAGPRRRALRLGPASRGLHRAGPDLGGAGPASEAGHDRRAPRGAGVRGLPRLSPPAIRVSTWTPPWRSRTS